MFRSLIDGEIELGPLEPADAEELFRLTDRNRRYLRLWLPWLDSSNSARDTLAFIEATRQQWAANNGFQLAVRFRGELAGVIGFHAIDWANRSTSIGYWLAEAHQGRGIMTRACRALVEHAFDSMRLNRLEIRCAVGNSRSRAIPERLGFHAEGTLRQTEWLYDRFVDHLVYGLLVTEWRNGAGPKR